MITGYNTDVRHGETVFHVQTEDKGLSNPQIESLIYVGGQVLAAKRASYADLIEEGKGEKDISDRMDHQHRVMIRAIRAGKFDAKLEALRAGTSTVVAKPGGILDRAGDDAAPSLDQVILDYLTSEARQERLQLAMDGESEFVPGAHSVVELRATSSRNDLPVEGAQVNVKMISTVQEPQQLARGVTDEDGWVQLEFDVPAADGGAAALIITASSVIGSAELKHLL